MAVAGRRFFMPSHSPWEFLVCLLLVLTTVQTEMYESIQWSPQNPKFRFTSDKFASGEAYYRMSVLTSSSIHFVCPNPTMIFGVTKMSISKEELNENLWVVDKSSFETCNINRNNPKNKLLLRCIWNTDCKQRSLSYKVVFQQYSAAASGLEFNPGHEYYFIATSNGLENSVNDTSGGHCKDKAKGLSMRVAFYICKDSSECSHNTSQPINVTEAPDNINVTEPPNPEAAALGSSSSNVTTFLAIGFGAAFGVSLFLNVIIVVFSVWRWRSNSQDLDDGGEVGNVPEKKKKIGKNGCEPGGVENKGVQSQISQVSVRADDKPLLNSEEPQKKTLLQKDLNKAIENRVGNGVENTLTKEKSRPPVARPRREAPKAPTTVHV